MRYGCAKVHLVKHVAITLVVGIVLLLLLGKPIGIELFLIVAGSLLIDIDHLWLPSVREHPRKLYDHFHHTVDVYLGELKLFHTYEFQALVLLLGLFWTPLLWFFLGLFLHLLEDAYTNTRKKPLKDWLPDYSLVNRVIRAMKNS